MSRGEFNEYVKTKDVFRTSFAVGKHSSLPEMGGNVSYMYTMPTSRILPASARCGN